MPYWTDDITRVRIGPPAIDLEGGRPAAAPDACEVTWESLQAERWHQVYVNGRLAGVTARPEDRRLIVPAPAGACGAADVLYVEVVAVDAADRWTDFSAELTGFAPECGPAARLTWQAGLYLDENLASFDVFADGRTGSVDYAAPINDAPIPALAGGQAPWGYGCGGYGAGGYGRSAALYEYSTGVLEPGAWRFAVVALDAAGNRLTPAAEIALNLAPVPRPPGDFRVASYDPVARQAMLAWQPSPDV
ncbi:MAG: hypothetical protein FJ288_08885 [Planctomycetes bacterium]|nr:hypothetical protein [Planctomycetota bacterium]